MEHPEIYAIILEQLAMAHDHGEAFWGQVQMWISGSFAVILTAHFAPQRMNTVIGGLLAFLYISFSLLVTSNALEDVRSGNALIGNAYELAAAYDIDVTHLDRSPSLVGTVSFFIFPPALFFGTLGYLAYTVFTARRR